MHLCRRVYDAVIGGMQLKLFFFSLLTNLLPTPSATNYLPFVYINHAHTFQSPLFHKSTARSRLLHYVLIFFFTQNISFSNDQQTENSILVIHRSYYHYYNPHLSWFLSEKKHGLPRIIRRATYVSEFVSVAAMLPSQLHFLNFVTIFLSIYYLN